ncbi:MAG: hypothetical protein JWR83_2500 [Aeromicrobium sp.]|nr:hypothetical protein [Aeromicrobium sp.]
MSAPGSLPGGVTDTMAFMRTTLILGADGAPFARDLAAGLGPGDELTVIAPTVRDRWATGLKLCPDLDALLESTGAEAPTFAVADELSTIGYSPAWQRPSDHDVATQLIRTELLGAGYSLTDATAAMAARRELTYRLLPMSDDRAEFHVVLVEPDGPRAIHVAHYLGAPDGLAVDDVVLVAETWSVTKEVSEQLAASDVIVLGPSSRTLAIDPVLRTPGFLDLIDDWPPVLVVDHADTAPADLIRAAGLSQPDPGRAERVPADADAVLARAHELSAS